MTGGRVPSRPSAGGIGAERRALYRGQAAACRRELSNLLEGDEHHAVDFFARLVVATVVSAGPATLPLWARMSTAAAGVLPFLADSALPSRLRLGWLHWEVMREFLVDRNPRLALADLLGEVGETVDGSDWPVGRELQLLGWVDRGERLPLPWRAEGAGRDWDEDGYRLLCGLRAEAGGWVFFDRASGRRVFRPDAAVPALRDGCGS